MTAMHIALLSPYSIGTMRGNITTVRRINRFLNKLHVKTVILAADTMSVNDMAQRLAPSPPTLIHSFHARYCGETSVLLADRFKIPFVMTITGSDLYDPTLRDHPVTLGSLEKAAAIVCFSSSVADELVRRFAALSGRVVVIAQGVEAIPDSGKIDFGIPKNDFIILLPAALRKVKNIEFAISAVKGLWEVNNRIRLVIAGGEIDRTYANEIHSKIASTPWSDWIGEVPHEHMGALYRRADIVLNCSLYEGMPNSLMEAMALGRPVLATDIPGNRTLVQHGVTGWLFNSESAFREIVEKLSKDNLLRMEVGRCARNKVEVDYSPFNEAQQYQKLYSKLICRENIM